MKIDNLIGLVIFAVAILLLESTVFLMLEFVLFKFEFPDRGFFAAIESKSAPATIIFKNTTLLATLRLVFYTPFFVILLWLLKNYGLLEKTWVVPFSNLFVYISISVFFAIIFPFTRDYFQFGSPYYQNTFFYLCCLTSFVSPWCLILLLPESVR